MLFTSAEKIGKYNNMKVSYALHNYRTFYKVLS